MSQLSIKTTTLFGIHDFRRLLLIPAKSQIIFKKRKKGIFSYPLIWDSSCVSSIKTIVLYQIQHDQQNQTEEHKQPNEEEVPKRCQTLFVKEANSLHGIKIASETPAIPSNTAPTLKVRRIFIMVIIHHISDNFTNSTGQ